MRARKDIWSSKTWPSFSHSGLAAVAEFSASSRVPTVECLLFAEYDLPFEGDEPSDYESQLASAGRRYSLVGRDATKGVL